VFDGDAYFLNGTILRELLNSRNTPAREDATYGFVDVGFHGDIYLLDVVDKVAREGINYFIETGSNVGSTLAYFAKKYPHVKCLSCEPDPEAYKRSLEHTKGLKNVQVFNLSSQDFIELLKSDYSYIFGEKALFWLDAHGYGFEWPLKGEVSFVSGNFGNAYILVDDFKVPGRDHFGCDIYQGQICSFDYIRDSINPSRTYQLYYPTYYDRTSKHHPLRGWGLLVFGHEGFYIPEHLGEKMERVL
jgi:hypothetical protein